jgi:murein DD-endopeptidase MepM/ murein hydrolase activator NlpD
VSIYGNLAQETLVSTGDHVTAGCVLGQVGQTAAGEAGQVSHLHFGVKQNGEAADPESFY